MQKGGKETITIKEYPEGSQYLVWVFITKKNLPYHCEAKITIVLDDDNGSAKNLTLRPPSDCEDSKNWEQKWIVGCFNSRGGLARFDPINIMTFERFKMDMCYR